MQSKSNRATGLRVVATFEASKGILVLLVGLGIFSLVHHSAQNTGEAVVQHFHLNFLREHPRILIYAATHLDNSHLRLLAVIALVYVIIRFIEAYGLWHMRNWAEWFAIVSGGVYLPFEMYELIRHPTVVKTVILVLNAGIVAYLVYFRWNGRPRSGFACIVKTSGQKNGEHKRRI
ncbi:MAG TPA: DUF2127 domain-containing protein [Pyrinomonadaceae bacterium]|nr:DUF2127 domain-containing protein [Pyrinomonadaceae bacterium]